MTTHASNGSKPVEAKILTFHHLKFWVGNAKQAASYYCTRMGFEPLGYCGLETGSRRIAAHAVRQNKIIFIFESAYEPNDKEMASHLSRHGDGVRDIAFDVEGIDSIFNIAKERGAEVVCDLWEEEDEYGVVRFATVRAFGDTLHTFVDRTKYKGFFLPGFRREERDPMMNYLPEINLKFIDHVVGNLPVQQMELIAKRYEDCLQFHRFPSVDEILSQDEISAARLTVVTNSEETIKIPISEPVLGKTRSQVQEFVEYYGGAGIQHIALNTNNIIVDVTNLRKRGIQFLDIPDTYYDMLRERLQSSKVNVAEDLDILQKLKILIDYDENGYILQIFTKLMQDRPTLFIEIIQRRNHCGFGAGNIRALFIAAEKEQAKRGNL